MASKPNLKVKTRKKRNKRSMSLSPSPPKNRKLQLKSLSGSQTPSTGSYRKKKKKQTSPRRRTTSDARLKKDLKPIISLTNSKSAASLSQATKDLSFMVKTAKKQINTNFQQFEQKLGDQKNKLLDDIQIIQDKKREEIIQMEQKIFDNSQKSKKSKQKQSELVTPKFDIKLVIDSDHILSQIDRYGYINTGTNDTTYTTNIITTTNDDDSKIDSLQTDFDINDSRAKKQKLILGEIQKKTMDKLDMVILMEAEAKKRSAQASALRIEVDDGLKYIAERSKIVNEKIALATPNLEKAREVAAGIDPKDINEIKTLKAPPTVIENVITATVMLLGHKIKSWRDVIKLLSYKFKPQLLNFDTYTLTKKTRQLVYNKYAGKKDFTYERVVEGNKACGNLVLWVHSQIKYSEMLDVIRPLEKEVKKLQKESKKKEKLAKQLMIIVAQLQENIKLYTDQCNEMIEHIIKSTDYELKQFTDKLQPLNDKFNELLNKKL